MKAFLTVKDLIYPADTISFNVYTKRYIWYFVSWHKETFNLYISGIYVSIYDKFDS